MEKENILAAELLIQREQPVWLCFIWLFYHLELYHFLRIYCKVLHSDLYTVLGARIAYSRTTVSSGPQPRNSPFWLVNPTHSSLLQPPLSFSPTLPAVPSLLHLPSTHTHTQRERLPSTLKPPPPSNPIPRPCPRAH